MAKANNVVPDFCEFGVECFTLDKCFPGVSHITNSLPKSLLGMRERKYEMENGVPYSSREAVKRSRKVIHDSAFEVFAAVIEQERKGK